MGPRGAATAAGPVVHELRHFIGGEWAAGSGAPVEDINPAAFSQVIARGRTDTVDEVDAAVAAAAGAYPAWREMLPDRRGQILSGAARILVDRAQLWGEELALEEGKTRAEGVGEVLRAAEILQYFSGEPLRATGELFDSGRRRERVLVERLPVGVVAVITPFNFPIAIPAWKIAPAVSYGNTVVWKCAESVPLLAMRLASALEEAGLPSGVLNLVLGDAAAGSRLVEHPHVDAVTFTGSTAVGRSVIATCGRLGRPVQAEMGGVNPAVIMPSADLDAAAAMVILGAFSSAGQKCSATSRLVLHERIADRFLDHLIEKVANWTVGDPLAPETNMGPVISAAAQRTINEDLSAGIAEGARVLTGLDPYPDGSLAGGYFVAPTIMEVKSTDSSLWTHEIFGPTLTTLVVGSFDEALAAAEAGPFGLTAAVFTQDIAEISQAMRTLRAGVLHINSETTGADPHVPFGGAGESGYGPKEQGRSARDFFTTTRTVYLRPL